MAVKLKTTDLDYQAELLDKFNKIQRTAGQTKADFLETFEELLDQVVQTGEKVSGSICWVFVWSVSTFLFRFLSRLPLSPSFFALSRFYTFTLFLHLGARELGTLLVLSSVLTNSLHDSQTQISSMFGFGKKKKCCCVDCSCFLFAAIFIVLCSILCSFRVTGLEPSYEAHASAAEMFLNFSARPPNIFPR